MVFALVLLYHLLLIGGLILASGSLSMPEIVLALGLIGLGSAALVETSLMIEPRHRRRRAA